jgi:hypothetical protein
MPINEVFHSSIAAAWLFVGKEVFPEWPHWPSTMGQARSLTGAGKSQSYEMAARLRETVATLAGQPGRPTSQPPQEHSLFNVSKAVLDYLMRNPGAAEQNRERGRYSDGFRRFVVGLSETGQPGEGLSIVDLAEGSGIALGTLKQWFGAKATGDSNFEVPEPQGIRNSHLRQVVTLYQNWQGTFRAFCKMVREQYRLNYGTTYIGTLLERAGLRHRKSHNRKKTQWDRNTFRSLFPGAQWLGDGTDLTVHGIDVTWETETFVFNMEVILDVASNALVGCAVSDFEDQEVVIRAYEDATVTAGQPPLALSLDNRSCNHTPEVSEALGEATLLATTLGRGQSKAPLEGAFGLFNQEMPALLIEGQTPREKARSILELVFTAWARGRNGRPRKKLGDKSPADFYRDAQPTNQEAQAAKDWIQELQRRQAQLRRTREARADPAKLELLRQGLADLGIPDPDGRLALRLAYYSRDAIVLGLSTFKAKQIKGTIPDDALPGRYLGGIIRNADEKIELELISEFLITNRELLRDLSVANLAAQAHQLRSQPLDQQLAAYVERAVEADLAIDYHFWTSKSVGALSGIAMGQRMNAYRNATRRIAASFKADRQRKQNLLARLATATTEG